MRIWNKGLRLRPAWARYWSEDGLGLVLDFASWFLALCGAWLDTGRPGKKRWNRDAAGVMGGREGRWTSEALSLEETGLKWEGKMRKEAVGSPQRRQIGLTQWDQESAGLQHYLPIQGSLCQIQLPSLLPSEGHGQILEDNQYLES